MSGGNVVISTSVAEVPNVRDDIVARIRNGVVGLKVYDGSVNRRRYLRRGEDRFQLVGGRR
jgi:hypothetical protein